MEIPSSNFRHFASALTLLSKIGKEILVEVEPSRTTFKALSDAKSSFGHVCFNMSFFSFYSPSSFSQQQQQIGNNISGSGNLSNNGGSDYSFKVSAKVICSICRPSIMKGLSHVTLRSSNSPPSSSSSSASAVDENRSINHELIIEIVMLSGVRRVHRISSQSADSITATYHDSNPLNSVLTSNPCVFTQVINHIGASNEILIEAGRDSFEIKTFYGNAASSGSNSNKDFLEKNNMSSGVSLRISEFESYAYNGDSSAESSSNNNNNEEDGGDDSGCVDLVVPIKEFKSFLNFSESLGISEFELMFTRGGAPVRLSATSSSNVDIFIILASLLPQIRSGGQRGGEKQSAGNEFDDDRGGGGGGGGAANNHSNNNSNGSNSNARKNGHGPMSKNEGSSSRPSNINSAIGDRDNRANDADEFGGGRNGAGDYENYFDDHDDGGNNVNDDDNNNDTRRLSNGNNDNQNRDENNKNDEDNDDNNNFGTFPSQSQKVDFSNLIDAYNVQSPEPNNLNRNKNDSNSNSNSNSISISNSNCNKRTFPSSSSSDASNNFNRKVAPDKYDDGDDDEGAPRSASKRSIHSKIIRSQDSEEENL